MQTKLNSWLLVLKRVGSALAAGLKAVWIALTGWSARLGVGLKSIPPLLSHPGDLIKGLPALAARLLRKLPGLFWTGIKRFLRTLVVLIIASPVLLGTLAGRMGDWLQTGVSMVAIVFKRMRHNLGLAVSALVGVVAVLAMVVCVPIFSHSVSGEVLRQQLEDKALSTRRYLFSMHMYYIDKRDASPMTASLAKDIAGTLAEKSRKLMGINIERIITKVQSSNMGWKPLTQKGAVTPDDPWMVMSFVTQDNLPELADLVEGVWPSPQTTNDGPIQVAVYEQTADESFLNLGDIYQYNGNQIQIVGIWRAKDQYDPRWFELPYTGYAATLWVPQQTYENRLGAFLPRTVFYTSWYIVYDEKTVQFTQAPTYAKGMVQMSNEMSLILPGITTDYSPQEALVTYQQRADQLTTLFYAVGGPMVVLALLFISLTAMIAVQQYEQETVTMRGRGTSWGQIISLNLIESGVLLVLALLPSLAVGWLAAGLMGKTLSFLKFTNRTDIPFTFQGVNFLWLLVVMLIIVAARFMPNLGISRTSIVRLKQEQSRGSRQPLWQRFFLDFFLLIPGIYAYATMSGFAKPVKFLADLQESGGQQYRDLLLFVAPALFAMALCMILLRILPLLTRLLAFAVDRLPGVWAYLSIQQIARRPQEHTSALLLIMISLSLAIFSASTAKTLDKWSYDSQYYKAGADLVIHEYVVTGGAQNMFGAPAATSPTTLSELDLNTTSYVSMEEHMKLPSVKAATRVGKYPGTLSYGVGEVNCVFMGIDRLDFPKVAFLRDDFASQPMGALMNALAMEPMGVLIPKSMADSVGLRLGDHLLSTVKIFDQNFERDFIIVGTFDYFPTIYPAKDPTVVVNLESLFDNPDAVLGYDVWLSVKPDTDLDLLTFQLRSMIGQKDAVIKVNGDALTEVRKSLDQPERVGLFGVLNVGFIVTGLMPGIGFVLYSYASLRRRFIQLGILQAVGLSVKQLVGYLVLEQALLMGLAIAGGAAIGLMTSQLFVPFLQIGAAPGQPIPPFEVLIGWTESFWLSLAFGLVLSLTMIGTIGSLVRMKVFQAVKMGETM